MQKAWRLAQRIWRLLRSPFLPASLKRSAVRTQVLLSARRYGKTADGTFQARILDFEVIAHSRPILAALFEQIFVNGDYFFVSKKAGPFILDCGSNIGMSIVFFKALYPKAKIIGFEPEDSTYALLEKNIASNGFKEVQLHQVALGMEDATTSFFVDPETPGSLAMSTIRSRLLKKEIVVRQRKLSTYIDREVDLLKLDVEGAELAVLQDLVSTGTITRINQMIVEYHANIHKNQEAFSSFLGQLEKSGFGYQISTSYPNSERASWDPIFQDVLVYAYRMPHETYS
jgi:FkbM family methyltransferase